MELVVAISIAGVMILMINVLFRESVRAVSLGTGTSRVLHQSNTINTQLAVDFGIDEGTAIIRNSLNNNLSADKNNPSDQSITDTNRVGFLLIAHHQIQNLAPNTAMTYPVPANVSEENEVFLRAGEINKPFFPLDSDGDGNADIRSDQLMFLRDVYDGERPITPQNVDALGNDNPVGAALIWYGHLQPTTDDGTQALDGTGGNRDFFLTTPANQWIFGRQARFFSREPGGSGDPDDPTFDLGSAGGFASDPVYNPGSAGDMRFDVNPVDETPTYGQKGLVDPVAALFTPVFNSSSGEFVFRYSPDNLLLAANPLIGDLDQPASFSPPRGFQALSDLVPVRADELFHVFGNGGVSSGVEAGPLSSALNPASPADNTSYAENAAEIAYAYDRLWVNPRPHDPATGDPTRLIEAWQQAQMHPYLAAGISDFEVHFAGDYDNDGSIANGFGTPDDQIDVDGDGNVRWYNSSVDGQNNLDINGGGVDVIGLPDKAAVAPADQDRYPIREFDTAIGNPAEADLVYVWRHDEPQSWPDLIRIRYRIHDAAGRISDRQLDTDNDGIPDENIAVPGRLVDVIFRIPG
ncbi:MAG: hypothetical protein AAGK09_03280 [Planctomycetota bacterium]